MFTYLFFLEVWPCVPDDQADRKEKDEFDNLGNFIIIRNALEYSILRCPEFEFHLLPFQEGENGEGSLKFKHHLSERFLSFHEIPFPGAKRSHKDRSIHGKIRLFP